MPEISNDTRVLVGYIPNKRRLPNIYALVDPRDGVVRFVGKAVNPQKRFRHQHWPQRNSTDGPKNRWLRELDQFGLQPRIVILDEVRDGNHAAAEQRWIDAYRDTVFNVRPGGVGAPQLEDYLDLTNRKPSEIITYEQCKRAIAMRRRGTSVSTIAEMLGLEYENVLPWVYGAMRDLIFDDGDQRGLGHELTDPR